MPNTPSPTNPRIFEAKCLFANKSHAQIALMDARAYVEDFRLCEGATAWIFSFEATNLNWVDAFYWYQDITEEKRTTETFDEE